MTMGFTSATRAGLDSINFSVNNLVKDQHDKHQTLIRSLIVLDLC